jgi:dynein heavy chain, axonemal
VQVGLEKLEFTEQQVSVMQGELEALRPNLIQTVAETEALMAQVSKEKIEVVEPKKAVVDAEVAKAEEAAAAANSIKTECEEALAVAMPVLESALYDSIADARSCCLILCSRCYPPLQGQPVAACLSQRLHAI